VFRSPHDVTTAPPHPGEILREHLLPRLDMTPGELARHLGVPAPVLEDFLAERRPVCLELALRLGQALGEGARYWLGLQIQHDLWRASEAEPPRVEPIDWSSRRRNRPRAAA
jgi:addiction module HigA family antidote